MTLLRLQLRHGASIFDQVVYAAQRAFLAGEYQPGESFPSVRALAADLKIHPNTAHKVVQQLILEGWLEVRPGVGTVAVRRPEVRATERRRVLQQDVEALVVEAKRVGLTLHDVIQSLNAQWNALDANQEKKR